MTPRPERVSPGILTSIPPPLHYGLHRPAPVASSAGPVPAALSASAGQWPASLVIRLPFPTARSTSAAAPWYADTTTTPIDGPPLVAARHHMVSGPGILDAYLAGRARAAPT